MTREEVITVLQAFMDNPLFSDIHKAVFSIAIHDIKRCHDWDINKLMLVPKTELEQEPCEMNWLELGQRVESLLEDMRVFRVGEKEFPKTADIVIELLEQIITVMDEAIL